MPTRWGTGQRFFDRWSRVYDDPLAQRLVYRPLHDAVLRALRRQAPGSVLDVGCGTGLFSRRVARELGVATVGCDYSLGMLQQAAAGTDRVAWVQGDAASLPVADHAVEAVVCTESFHWYPDQPAALSEFARVLTPGGLAYLAMVNPPFEAVSRTTRRWSRYAGRPLRWPTSGALRTMARRAGLTVVHQGPVTRVVSAPLLPAVLTVVRA